MGFNYLNHGLDGLLSKPHPGRTPSLSEKQQQLVAQFIHLNAAKPEGGRLIGEDIRCYILDNFQVNYTLRNVYKLIHSLGFSWITSRSKHPKQSPEVQEAFKKFRLETILHTPFNVHLEQIDVWFQDEARFGQQNQTTRLWAPKGSRPRAIRQQQFDYGYLFGAVCP